MISGELAAFLESGIAVIVGTRDARLEPDCVRAVGAKVEAGGKELTVYLPAATSERSLANLGENGRIAALFSRPRDHRSFQVKGSVVAIREATESDRAVVDRYRGALAEELGVIGMPPRVLFRVAHWPCHAVRLRVESVFVQTPGPGAGAPLGSPEGTRR